MLAVPSRLGVSSRPFLALAGFAASVGPLAILVHLVAEAIALGSGTWNLAFVERHLYMLPPLAFSIWWFAAQTGIGRSSAERLRRCALMRAGLRSVSQPFRSLTILSSTLAFFAITQALEGSPIAATGHALSLAIGLLCAVAGSLAASFFVFRFGRAFIAAVITAIAQRDDRTAYPARAQRRRGRAVRCAAATFTLFRPNRPPPLSTLA
jgi:hypothetical protein